jgi:CRISPR/Cas system CSM-associated protein Csm3 (group 7 of RAMP superfamily)
MAQQNRNNNRNDQRNGGPDNRSNNPRLPEQEIKVTSPYNFVPLNKEVYFPSWGPLVSHDVPFEEGLSGSFDVEIEAMSPIFIRGTQIDGDNYFEQEDKKGNKEKITTEFMFLFDKNGEKRYFIPASSIRNMLRSIVEIIGFGRMARVNEVKNDKIKFGIKGPLSAINNQPDSNKSQPIDLPETMFGEVIKIKSEKNLKYKGRIFVSHGFCSSKVIKKHNLQELIMGGPKPTFFPFYLKQNTYDKEGNVEGSLKKWDFNSEISGRKRYPVHYKFTEPIKSKNAKVGTSFLPLAVGTKFKTSVSYHNLKPIELGALLSAITFHNNDGFYHNLGFGKPLGFGKIKFSISDRIDIEHYLSSFESEMNFFLHKIGQNEWFKTPQIQEFYAMAKNDQNQDPTKLIYPKLENFKAITEAKLGLSRYTLFMDIQLNEKVYNDEKKIENEFYEEVPQIFENVSHTSMKNETLPENLEIKFDKIELNLTQIEFKIISLDFPKKALIVVNGEEMHCQFTIPKHVDSSPFQIGTIQSGVITHFNLEKKVISQIKIID